MSTFIDGIGQCEVVDKSGELVDLKGHDISSLDKSGVFNWEHKSDTPATLVGKILESKKIYSKADCENERHLRWWNECKIPYLYVMGELLDDYTDSAKECAGQMKYSQDHPGQSPLLGFSIEGSEIPNTRKGMVITRSIARKCTLTASPCNSMCRAEIFIPKNKKSKVKDDFDELFKSKEEVITLFKSGEGEKLYEQYLAKKESEPKGVPHGWTPSVTQHKRVGTITSLTHPEHGMVSVHKNPKTSKYEVNHAGRTAGIKGKKGIFDDQKQAVGHMQKYVHALHNGSVLGRTMHAPDATDIKKAISAGSYNAAPSTLVNGAAYQSESMPSKKDWNKQSKDDYENWSHKDKFESFMKARMPHLADGEIRAIGRVVALKKNLDLEKAIANLVKKN